MNVLSAIGFVILCAAFLAGIAFMMFGLWNYGPIVFGSSMAIVSAGMTFIIAKIRGAK